MSSALLKDLSEVGAVMMRSEADATNGFHVLDCLADIADESQASRRHGSGGNDHEEEQDDDQHQHDGDDDHHDGVDQVAATIITTYVDGVPAPAFCG
jgi:ABC-type Zn2+ transport system substrate-binding protein/surface adhesin